MPQKNDDQFLNRRRQLLKMGAAGMPMALTLRAGATEAVVSQLRCVITIPSSMKILVDEDGAAWVGDRKLRKNNDGTYKESDVKKFKENADYSFNGGSVPSRFRPECQSSGGGWGDDDGGGWGDDDGCSSDDGGGWGDDHAGDVNLLADLNEQTPPAGSADFLWGTGGGSGGWGDDSGDDDCSSEPEQCYAVYKYSQGNEITPGNYTNGGSGWSIGGASNAELYIALSLQYEESHGGSGSWPGISCIVSIINYLN